MRDEMNKGDRKKTILYIGGFELPDKNAAAHRVLSNAKLFRQLGYNTVFVGTDKSGRKNNSILDSKKLIEGFDSYCIEYPKSVWQWLGYIFQIDKYLEVAADIPNLEAIVCYNFPAIALVRIRTFCRKRGIKCIADVTEWYTGSGRSLPVKIVKNTDTFLRMRIIQKDMDGLIVISRYLQEYYRGCSNVVYIPPLTDLSDPKWENKPRNETNTLYLAYAGSPGTKDRIDLLIAALKSVKRKYHLDIVGIEKDVYLSMYRDDSVFLKENKDIVFHGRLPHKDALEIIKRANYSCFFRVPDRLTMAGFPTKFSEAVSCGTPVITNRSSNIADYLLGENGYLVDALTNEAISDLIDEVAPYVITDTKLFDYRRYEAEMKRFLDNALEF